MTASIDPRGAVAGAERSFFFDIVRGLSAQLVLVGHALNVCFPDFFMSGTAAGPLEARKELFFAQNLGVLFFFCISGYLVTASVVRRSVQAGYGLQSYLFDRFARIFTPLVPLLLILFVVENLWFGNGTVLRYTVLDIDLRTLALNLTMLFDHPLMSALSRATGWTALKAGAFGSADQLWTVVIEWWIYVTFGLLAFPIMRRKRWSARLIMLLALAAVVPAYALSRGNGLIVAWIAGMLFSLGRRPLLRIRRSAMAAACVGAGTLASALLLANGYNFYSPVVAGLFSVWLFTLYHLVDPGEVHPARWSIGGLLKGLSNMSYSVYLVHLSILFWILAFVPEMTGRPSTLVLLVLVANITAALFYLGFERHYIAVRRLLSRRLGASAVPRLG